MAEIRWQPGDKVKIKSGGPVMVVVEQRKFKAGNYPEEVSCEWFDEKTNKRESDIFSVTSLEKVN